MRSILFLAFCILILSFTGPYADGQILPTGVSDRAAPVPQFQALPDLVIAGLSLEAGADGKSTINVSVQNRGDTKYASASVHAPVEVWLRIWKPSQPQGLTEMEPKGTSYVWGGVLKLTGLSAGMISRVSFPVTKPPGGWETKAFGWSGSWAKADDPMRLRIVARVDPKNTVTESNESNNATAMFQSAPAPVVLGPALSIKEVRQSTNEPFLKVLVENIGKQRSGPASKLTFDLQEKIPSLQQNMVVMFWTTGKPAPHEAESNMVWGTKMGPSIPALTQQQVDAMPSTTMVPKGVSRTLTIPPLDPGGSTWLSIDVRLPDPGTYVRSDLILQAAAWGWQGGSSAPDGYITALPLPQQCGNMTAFFASQPRVFLRLDQKNLAPGTSAITHYENQFHPGYLKFAAIPPGKYEGKCK